MDKTVYILGAGFSVEAGAPTQASIIKEAFRIENSNTGSFKQKEFTIFKDFLSKQLNMPDELFPEVELEDIFTPLDRCLSDSSQYRGIGLDQIMEIRQAVFYVVGKTIQVLLDETQSSKQYIDDFAKYLVQKSSIRANNNYRQKDPVSVISTNWDILLDNSVYKAIAGNNDYDAVVDYCCYISSKDEKDISVKPGLEKLGEGGFNVKLLKVHGSLNWLQCPRCARLYARFSNKEAVHSFTTNSSCRHCDKNFSEEAGKHVLTPNLIMPTFIKDLSNPQYRIIWQNAGIELSEASKIVFIGYSLPSADFEMRQLLSRMTRKDAIIEVVDYCKNDDSHLQQEARNNLEKHWRKFFGNRKIQFHFDGAKNYLQHLEP
ncbi:hypothetical protein ACET7O_12595 [Aeromonas veronii]